MNIKDKSGAPSERLTSSSYWDSCYASREQAPFDGFNWKNLASIQIARSLETLLIDGKEVCEVGGGDGEVLTYFAKRHLTSRFSIIDFSPVGCDLARGRAIREGAAMNIYQEDIFSPRPELLGHFDLVISQGVVEHFTDLGRVMAAKRRLLKKGGKAFTLIPNFSSPIYAYLCKRWSKSVYEDHVPHDMNSFLTGHEQAELNPLEYGYLGAIEFGMLSAAINGPEHKTWFDRQLYIFLTRLSKAIHFLEYKTNDFPATRLLSPYMYVISAKSS
jgi:SAM-dependent methyltransferase